MSQLDSITPAEKEPILNQGILMPADYSFEALNAFAHHPDVHFHELQWALLSVPRWMTGLDTPTPSRPGVKADSYLVIPIHSDRPEVLCFVYEERQWTRNGDDTQHVKYWMPIPPMPTDGHSN